VLVTGGAGFIGSHIVDRLLAEGHVVAALDNLSTGKKENVNCEARFFHLDIVNADLKELFAAERFDCVIHLAAQTAVPRSLAEPDYDCQVNVLGTVNILEAARQTGVKRVIFSSSAAVYGDDNPIPIREDAFIKPTSFYGLSKFVAENYLRLYQQSFGVDFVILRYANVYGERQGDTGEGGVISIFARKLLNDQPVEVFGDGGQTRDFVYVSDVAAANCRSVTTTQANAVYNISTASEISVNSLLKKMAQVTGKDTEPRYMAPRKGDIYRSSLDNQAALKNLGWRPEISLADGLAATFRYLRH